MFLNFKKFSTYFLLSISLFAVTTSSANETPQVIEYQGNKLVLNGQGTRVVFFMKVYQGSLYLEAKSSDAEQIVKDNAPMAIIEFVDRDIEAKRVDKKKKDTKKEAPKAEEKKQATT